MNIRNSALILALGLAFAGSARAGLDAYAIGFNPRTGDTWMDAQLGEMNVLARADQRGFVDDVVVRFGAPRYLVQDYVENRHWAPGDVYYGCALAYRQRVPCADVLRDYEKNHGQGWGVIAQRMGIKPGSEAFHALKGDVGQANGKFRAHGKPVEVPGASRGPGADHGKPAMDAQGPGNSGKGQGQGKGGGKGKKGGDR